MQQQHDWKGRLADRIAQWCHGVARLCRAMAHLCHAIARFCRAVARFCRAAFSGEEVDHEQ